MKLKLINSFKCFRETFPPYGLGIINSYLNRISIDADIFDLDIVIKHDNSLEIDEIAVDTLYIRRHYDRLYAILKGEDFDPYIDLQFDKIISKMDLSRMDVIAMNCHDNEIYGSLYLAKKLKQKYRCLVMMGGTHIIRIMKNRLQYLIDDLNVDYIDYIVIKDEYSFFNALKDGKIKKKRDKKAEIFPDKETSFKDVLERYSRNFEMQLDFPLYNKDHLNLYRIDMKKIKYFFPRLNKKLIDKFLTLDGESLLILPYLFTTGCPLTCTFCFAGLQKFQKQQMNQTISTMKRMQKEYGCNDFFFLNDNIIGDKKFAHALFKRMRNEVGVQWCDSSSIKGLDNDSLERMWDAGCIQILFGLESASQKMLRAVNKNTNYNDLDYYTRCFEDCNRNGIWVVADLIAGLPYEDTEDIENTTRYLLKNRHLIDGLLVLPFSLYSTSPMYQDPEKHGLELVGDQYLIQGVKAQYGKEIDVFRKVYYRTTLFNEIGGGYNCWDKQKQIELSMQYLLAFVADHFQTQFSVHYPVFYLYKHFNRDKAAIRDFLNK